MEYYSETQRSNMICTFCCKKSNELWIHPNKKISCCKTCWGCNPIVARATLGKPFIPTMKNNFKPRKSL